MQATPSLVAPRIVPFTVPPVLGTVNAAWFTPQTLLAGGCALAEAHSRNHAVASSVCCPSGQKVAQALNAHECPENCRRLQSNAQPSTRDIMQQDTYFASKGRRLFFRHLGEWR